MHRLWIDSVAASPLLYRRPAELLVPIGETLPDVPIIPAQRSHGKPGTQARRSLVAQVLWAEPRTSASAMIGSEVHLGAIGALNVRVARPQGVVLCSV
jgi:hypothetical protein